jgi:hypothetical protein
LIFNCLRCIEKALHIKRKKKRQINNKKHNPEIVISTVLDEHQKANPDFVLVSKAVKYIAPPEPLPVISNSKVEQFRIANLPHNGIDNASYQSDSLYEDDKFSDVSKI